MKDLIPDRKIDFWIKNNCNVMLIGKHGIGKTHIVQAAAKRHNLRWKYFSCATLDPWVDMIGIPKVKRTPEGISYLDLVRPRAFAEDKVEFIMLDELNRSDPKVLNAVLELIQFRSINGKKFKNLRCVWAAINPPASETGDVNYNVQELDPALMTRFLVQVELPFKPAENYFQNKYGEVGVRFCKWWECLPEKAKDAFPPRSMDGAISFVQKGGDAADVLPKQISKPDFIRVLTHDVLNASTTANSAVSSVQVKANGTLTMDVVAGLYNAASVTEAASVIRRLRTAPREAITSLMYELLDSTVDGASVYALFLGWSLIPSKAHKLFRELKARSSSFIGVRKANWSLVSRELVAAGYKDLDRSYLKSLTPSKKSLVAGQTSSAVLKSAGISISKANKIPVTRALNKVPIKKYPKKVHPGQKVANRKSRV